MHLCLPVRRTRCAGRGKAALVAHNHCGGGGGGGGGAAALRCSGADPGTAHAA